MRISSSTLFFPILLTSISLLGAQCTIPSQWDAVLVQTGLHYTLEDSLDVQTVLVINPDLDPDLKFRDANEIITDDDIAGVASPGHPYHEGEFQVDVAQGPWQLITATCQDGTAKTITYARDRPGGTRTGSVRTRFALLCHDKYVVIDNLNNTKNYGVAVSHPYAVPPSLQRLDFWTDGELSR